MGDVAGGAAYRRPLSRAAGRGHGEAAAGDHLQLGWAFWLPGHQLEQGGAPWADPYTFRPEASASPNLQGWLLGIPFWPLRALLGNIWAYDLIVLLSIAAAGALTCWWLRALGLARGAALVGGLVFALAPYRLGQSTGHLLGLIAFLLPAVLLALERRRFIWAAIALTAIPLSGQIHLAMGAVVLALGYTWARVPRPTGGRQAPVPSSPRWRQSPCSRSSWPARSRVAAAPSIRCGTTRRSSPTSSRAASGRGSRSTSSSAG